MVARYSCAKRVYAPNQYRKLISIMLDRRSAEVPAPTINGDGSKGISDDSRSRGSTSDIPDSLFRQRTAGKMPHGKRAAWARKQNADRIGRSFSEFVSKHR
jgi:hypothetical protein